MAVNSPEAYSSHSVEAFIHHINQPYNGIPGKYLWRISGSFDLNTHKVIFAGSTHAVERMAGLGFPDKNEMKYIQSNLIDHFQNNKITTLLIEEGNIVHTQSTLPRVLGGMKDEICGLSDDFRKRILHNYRDFTLSTNDMDETAAEAAKHNITTINIDPVNNPEAIPFLFQNLGYPQTIQYLCREVSPHLHDYEIFMPQVVAKLVETYGGTLINPDEVKEIVKAYIPRFRNKLIINQDATRDITNSLREEFMVSQILTHLDGNVGLLTHTEHLLEILNRLSSQIQNFSHNPKQLSEPVLKRWQQLPK